MNKKIKKIVLCSLFSALTFLFTAYLKIPASMGQYIHAGDAIILISSCILPFPLGPIAGLIGGSLADLLTGYAYWAPFTAIIKFSIASIFSNKGSNIFNLNNILKSLLSGLISITGYYLATLIIIYFSLGEYGTESKSLTNLIYIAAIDSLPANLLQALVTIAFFCILAKALDKIEIKKHLER